MTIALPADRLLANNLERFLWADEEWLEFDRASATYWQSRLAQTTIDAPPDGRRNGPASHARCPHRVTSDRI